MFTCFYLISFQLLAIEDVEYKEVPDLFVVVPRPRILVDEGFVEPDAHDIEMGSVSFHSHTRKSSISTKDERKEGDASDAESESGSKSDSGSGSGSGSEASGSDDQSNGSGNDG